jgi:hypothetical protein
VRKWEIQSFAGYESYFDAIGFSWDGYVAGSNQAHLTNESLGDLVENKPQKQKFGRYLLTGGFVNGAQLVSEKLVDPNYATYIDEFPEINTQAALDAMRDKIITTRNLAINKYRIPLLGLPQLHCGMEIIVSNSQHDLAAETLYIVETQYDAQILMQKIIATDAFWQLPLKKHQQTTNANTDQKVGAIHESVNNPTGTGIQPRKITYANQTAPADPAEGESVLYVDENGDLIIKINVGGVVKTATIVDYSAL